jgi:hypothetical protein
LRFSVFCIKFLPNFLFFICCFSACSTGKAPSVIVAAKSAPIKATPIDSVKVIWSEKPYVFIEQKMGMEAKFDFATNMGLTNIPDSTSTSTYSKQEVDTFFSLLGNKTATKIAHYITTNSNADNYKYILEITPRKAVIQTRSKDTQQTIKGYFMLMVSLKDAKNMSELWFMKAYINTFSADSSDGMDEFSLAVIDNMKSSGLLK